MENIQDILTFTIVGGAFFYAIFKIFRLFIPSKNEDAQNKANGCGGGSCGCNSKDTIYQQLKPIQK